VKAVVLERYGTSEVLQIKEVEKPAPKEGEVLIKVHAASLNYGDQALVTGKPFFIRLMGYGLLKPKYSIIGTDIAGTVEAVGANVKHFQSGDAVFADISEHGFGAFGEYVSVPEEALMSKPANLTNEEAAAVPQAAVVALQGLRKEGQLQAGEKVLVNGASGGIGTFAVQIARALGAEVTGVCSTRNMDLVHSLGADHVIDYTREDFTRSEQRYDLILDIVANRPVADHLRVLNPGGRYVACAFNLTSLVFGPVMSKAGGKKVCSLIHKPDVKDLAFLKELLEAGKVVPVIDRRFPLCEAAKALQYLADGHHRGKVVISVSGSEQV
jgi:NADPH:quinone reductase-like Zn-dependent oxidoreductase